MPIYEYICTSCDHGFEEFARSMTAGRSGQCPACGSAAVERRPSVFAARDGILDPGGVPAGARCPRCDDPDGPCSF